MIRIEEPSGWILITHPDHARLAGQFAEHWGNAEFAPPERRTDALVAVMRHDDAWAARDAEPKLTHEGRPSAFSRELVGAYSAFEEMDLAAYLAVRGQAAAMIAEDNPYAALVVSMHTVDLLTEQADVTALSPEDLALHGRFIADQRSWQNILASGLSELADKTGYSETGLPQRAFEFLQACDSLSLSVCVRYPRPIKLRHTHPDRAGERHSLLCTPLGNDTYQISPYPFDQAELRFDLPCRRVAGKHFADRSLLLAAWAAAPLEMLQIRIVSGAAGA